ncbi:MAG: hypothetical protein OEU25_20155, partial [Rhodospirillales bacterium]|nr:hypothetical protein [Rhodospirillales bacterium]
FPYVIESADIAFYCAPSKGYVYKVDQAGRPEARDPRGKFQRVAWNAALIAALTQVHGNAPAPG